MMSPNACHSNQTPDCFETEKKELLKFLKDERLKSYYQDFILAEYKSFIRTKIEVFITTDYIYNKNDFYFKTLRRINDLAEFYIEMGDHQKSKSIIDTLIKFLPPDPNGQPYKSFPSEGLYGISNEEYSKRYFNLIYKDRYRELTWDYLDMSGFIKSIIN